jgi:hypothetical protein
MAIQPIDLQTLFLRMNQIAKDQAAQRDVLAHNQALQGSEIAERTKQTDNTVTQTDETSEGPNKMDEDGSGKGSEQEREEEQKKREREKKQQYVEDPDLGHNIDITG